MAAETLLVLEDLRVSFATKDGELKAVDGVSFELARGETLGVVGESGSGKSVMGLAVMRLLPAASNATIDGDVRLNGRSLLAMSADEVRAVRGDRIAMVFQDPMTSLNPVYRVGRQVAEPLVVHKHMRRSDAWQRAVDLLGLVGIPDARNRAREYPHQFSGGMRQRAMIAMALAGDPDVLIADEPTTALDVTIQAQILRLMEETKKRIGAATIVITHDLGVVADVADNVLVMYAGRPVEYASTDTLFYRPAHPYTWGLLDSVPEGSSGAKAKLHAIQGQPPSLLNVPSGCPFHPRCPCAKSVCAAVVPAYRVIDGAHRAACHFAGEAGFERTSATLTPGVSADGEAS
jgi:oligopeptide/dipeptide ABC transporter ATP-binding protein